MRLLCWNVGMGSPMPQGPRHGRAWSWVAAQQPLPDVLLLQQVVPGRFADGWPVAWSEPIDARGCRVAVAARPGWVVTPVAFPPYAAARHGGNSAVVAARVGPPDGPTWMVVSVHVGLEGSATRWLRYVVDALAFTAGPVVVGGDLNRPVGRAPASSRMFTTAAFAGFTFVCGAGDAVLPTTETSQTDHLWTRGVDPGRLGWRIDGGVRALGLADHAALHLTASAAVDAGVARSA